MLETSVSLTRIYNKVLFISATCPQNYISFVFTVRRENISIGCCVVKEYWVKRLIMACNNYRKCDNNKVETILLYVLTV